MDKTIEEMERELKNTKGQLDTQGEQLNSMPTATDGRTDIAAKAQKLSAMEQSFREHGEELEKRERASTDGVSAATVLGGKVDKERIAEFEQIREKYNSAKQLLDERIINNQDWWNLRRFGKMNTKNGTAAAADDTQKIDNRPKSVTSWGVNAIINKHADYMDNYPEPIFLPVEQGDEEYAAVLTSVVPAILERANYEQTYNDVMWDKPVEGTGVTGVFWESSLYNGLGDIAIKECSTLNLAWEPGVKDIQDSEYFFHTQVLPNDKIKAMFPKIKDLDNHLGSTGFMPKQYNYEGVKPDDTDCSLVVDVYYHTLTESGRRVLHYCKYVNDTVLIASENEEQYKETGYYKHGRYPFVFDALFPEEGSPCGFSYYDVMKDCLKDIDEFTYLFNHRAKVDSHPRTVYNKNCGIDVKQLADVTQEFVESDSHLDENNFKQIKNAPLDAIYYSYYTERINELKEISNNRDVSSGGTTAGVTAASAIAAMQEAGSKTSRDQELGTYRAFKNICYLVLELIAEFYTEKRTFRITGDNGKNEFIEFDNSGIKEQIITDEYGNATARKPIYDIKVKPQRRSAFSTLAHNEMMKELWGMGVFDPQTATQSAVLLQFMEFEGKDKLLSVVSKNGTIYQQLQQYQQIVMTLAQQVDALTGNQNTSAQVMAALQQGQVPMIGGSIPAKRMNTGGNGIADKAREQARSRAEVRS